MADIYSGWTALGSLAGGYRMLLGSSANAGGYAPVSWFAYRDASGVYQVGGQLGLPIGSASVPSMSFSNDGDTGFYRQAANVMGATAAGAAVFYIAPGGIGFGVTSPYCKIEIVDAVDSPSIGLGASAGGSTIGLDLWARMSALPAARPRGFIACGDSAIGAAGDLLIAARSSAGCGIRFLTGSTGVIERWRVAAGGTFHPGTDNTYDVGTASVRVKTYYGAAGAINTSDGREKTEIRAFTSGELSAAKRIAAEIGIFQFLASIEEKGEGGARLHSGVIAQDVWAIMADEGLIPPITEGVDPDCKYAFLCWDRWDEETTESGTVIYPAGDRFSIRPDELALFLIAAQEARLAALEAAA